MGIMLDNNRLTTCFRPYVSLDDPSLPGEARFGAKSADRGDG